MEAQEGGFCSQQQPDLVHTAQHPFTDDLSLPSGQLYQPGYASSSSHPQQSYLQHQQQFFSTEPEPSSLGPAFQFEASTSHQPMPLPSQHANMISSSSSNQSRSGSYAPPPLPASSPSARQPLSIVTQPSQHSSPNPVQHYNAVSPNSLSHAFPNFARAVETQQGGEWGRSSPSASQQSSYFPPSHPASPNRDPSLYAPSFDPSQSYQYPPSTFSTRPRSTTVNSINAFSPISGSILHTPSTTSGHSPSQTSSFNFSNPMSSHESPMLPGYGGDAYGEGMSFQANQMDYVGRGADDGRDGPMGFQLDQDMGGAARKVLSLGGSHTSTPDLSERVKALSLESKLRDIERILAASSSVTQQAAAMKKAILDGRDFNIPNDGGNLKEISRTLNAIASLDLPSQLIPSSAPSLLTPTAAFPTASASASAATAPLDASTFGDVSMSGRDESGPGGLDNVQVYSQAVPPTLTVDVVKSQSSKRPAPLTSPNLVPEDSATKYARVSDEIDPPQPTTLLAPPPLLHSHSFPSVEHQLLPSEEEQQTLLSHTPQPRCTSSLGVPLLDSSSPDPTPYSSSLVLLQQHVPIVPSPLAISSRAPSPTPIDQYGEPPSMSIEQPVPVPTLPDMSNFLDWTVAPSAHLSSQTFEPHNDVPLVYPSLAYSPLEHFQPSTAGPSSSSQATNRLSSTRPPSRRSSTAEGRPVVRLRGNTMGSDAELPSFLRPPERRSSQSHHHSAPYPPSSYQYPPLASHQPSPSSSFSYETSPHLQQPSLPVLQSYFPQQQQQQQQPQPSLSRRGSSRRQSDSPAEPPLLEELAFPLEGEGDVEHDHSEADAVAETKPRKKRTVSTKRSADTGADPAPQMSEELKAIVDGVFHRFLTNVCNNTDAKDPHGEVIHQVLMAKKMQRLDESWDFRPFKFRIQAFTNAFIAALGEAGINEEQVPQKRAKQYLWDSKHIARYNDDGKKAKSKGNHIWMISARKDGEGGWIFQVFERKIMGQLSHAFAGVPFSWKPHVWDPHVASAEIQGIVFSSPPVMIPSWLSWKDNELSGTPPTSARSQSIQASATIPQEGGAQQQLLGSFDLVVVSFPSFDPVPTFGSSSSSQVYPPNMFPSDVFAQQQQPQQESYDQPQVPFPEFPLSSSLASLEAEAAIQQSIIEKLPNPPDDMPDVPDRQLVTACDPIINQVLGDAHRSRQTQFLASGLVTKEFAEATVANARSRAIVAVRMAATLLPSDASTSDIIKFGEQTLNQAGGGFM